ncbi:MAG: ATP-binding protein [Candidatus Limnocylindrales bacterium]
MSAQFDNLPAPLTSFIGRDAEVQRIGELLARTRLLTLTGPGGTGKTRLAIEVAREAGRSLPDGVAFVALAPISDPQLVAPTIRQTLGLREAVGLNSIQTIAGRIRGSRMLLVLDNFEQVLDAAGTVAELLQQTKEPTILVTSRSPLHISGEQDVPVPPLRLPDRAAAIDPEALTGSEAVALFVQRATTVRPDFRLDVSNARTIVEICARLDGLPLAIELAASRVRLLPPEALLARLQLSLDFLQSNAADRTDRQRTLRATIDWSYDLLEPGDATAVRRLAIFVGGWDLGDAAAVVAPADGGELDVLERLVDHSLVLQQASAGEPRFGMLETIRQYGLEQLAGAGELDTVARAHADWFIALVIRLGPTFTTSTDALDLAERQVDNVRAALRWTIDHDELDLALEAVGALWRFWHLRGHLREGQRWASEVLDKAPEVSSNRRTRALNTLGGLTYWLGDYATAGTVYAAMLEAARASGDHASEIDANYSFGYLRGIDRDYPAAREAFSESGRVAAAIGDRLGVANGIAGVALIDLLDGRFTEARDGMMQAIPIFLAAGDRWLWLTAQGVLGRALHHLGEHEAARVASLEELDGAIDFGDGTLTAMTLGDIASAAADAGDFERALRLAGASRALVDQLGGGAPDALIGEPPADEIAVRAGVSVADIERLMAEGRELDQDAFVALAREAAKPA